MDFTAIRQLVAKDLHAVDAVILENLHSEVPLIQEIGHYIVDSGGKRLRPLVVLLTALAFNYQGSEHQSLAAIIEFIHTATLLHDDVVDNSTLRRGKETANALWGDHTSVLVGDFIYSRAFQMMVALNNMKIMDIMAQTTNTISEGEVLQLLNAHDPNTDETRYFRVIECKTAILFAAACEIAAVVATDNTAQQKNLARYGLNLGIAYQLIDDVLDYNSSAEIMGKNVGDDLAEGKPTLPLIYLLQHGSSIQQDLVRTAILHPEQADLRSIQTALQETGAITYTTKKALQHIDVAKIALQPLPQSPYKQALLSLCDFVVDRKN